MPPGLILGFHDAPSVVVVVYAVSCAVNAIVAASANGHVQPSPVMQELQWHIEEQNLSNAWLPQSKHKQKKHFALQKQNASRLNSMCAPSKRWGDAGPSKPEWLLRKRFRRRRQTQIGV